jgi:hypothetical protein
MTIATRALEARIANYKRLAGEARSKADETTDVAFRAILLEAAETWDKLAELEQKSASASATLTRLAEQSKKPREP